MFYKSGVIRPITGFRSQLIIEEDILTSRAEDSFSFNSRNSRNSKNSKSSKSQKRGGTCNQQSRNKNLNMNLTTDRINPDPYSELNYTLSAFNN